MSLVPDEIRQMIRYNVASRARFELTLYSLIMALSIVVDGSIAFVGVGVALAIAWHQYRWAMRS